MNEIKNNYQSPRWSGEILDCSMPLTFDQYSSCAFNCMYCFAFNQKILKKYQPGWIEEGKNYREMDVRSVNVELIKKQFLGEKKSQHSEYIKKGHTFQWGGLADPFDGFEKKFGVGLELMKFFSKIKYQIRFCTKADWWIYDERYRKLVERNHSRWAFQLSIINYDAELAKKIEIGCPSPQSRIKVFTELKELGVTNRILRLRPFIIGLSDRDYLQLIEESAKAGANSVSTEFLCIDNRMTVELRERYETISKWVDFDIINFYKKNSNTQGYLRLNQGIKTKYIDKMEKLCKKLGMRFYVSDAHHKDRCAGGCCCGLDESFNYQRGQYTEMLMLAKSRKDGKVYWKDIEKHITGLYEFEFRNANFNTGGSKLRAKYYNKSLFTYIKSIWNKPNGEKSPYKYFRGLLFPVGLDSDNNIVYKYKPYSQ